MQVAGGAYPASRPLYPYPTHYHQHHHPIPVTHDHELKRQYLTLLPPRQIVEICLTFDLHVPPYVKASIWPVDLNVAIAGLRKQAEAPLSKNGVSKNPSSTAEDNNGTMVDPLTVSPPEPSLASEPGQPEVLAEQARPQDTEPLEEPKPLGVPSAASSTEAPEASEPAPSSEATTPTPIASTAPTSETAPVPAPPISTMPAQSMSAAYPHQPYGYPYAPYYPPPPPGYPYHQYPAYLHHHQPQHIYPPPPPPPTMQPGPPPPPQPMSMTQDGQSPDDLPSYEEMIVEALLDHNDPEGCAPKDLFTWMAGRYPVQSNFRPSASQALQKAYKRGRLEKSSNNKYRLNAAWEGGSTSRRTTRRPQTHTHAITPSNPPPSSPFTNAPLVHHHHYLQQSHQHQPYGGHPYSSYPYPQSTYPGYSAPPAASAPQAQPAAAPTPAASTITSESTSADVQDKEVADAYEAAQSILKAINFGSLLQLPAEETQEGAASRGLQPHNRVNAAAHPSTLLAALHGAQSVAVLTPTSRDTPSNSRAELQAHLVLLAAQLAKLARADDAPRVIIPHVDGPSSIPAPVVWPPYDAPYFQTLTKRQPQPPMHSYGYAQPQSQGQAQAQTQPPLDNNVPMGSLFWPPETPQSQPEAQVQHTPAPLPTEEELPASPVLSPVEAMDSVLDGEYESDEDDDMEEVI